MKTPTFEEILETGIVAKKESKLNQILARNNNCKIYIGGSENDLIDYPYRLSPCDRVTERIRNAATDLMIDSTINDPDITNESVLEKAIEHSAQWVIPKDYWGEIDATHESLVEFKQMADEAGFAGNVIYPLQPPHDEHYLRYEEFYSKASFLALGGVKQESAEEQIEAAKTLRETVGNDVWIHGLGMGCSRLLIDEIWENPNLLDSIDTSTFERVPSRGKVADGDWIQHDIVSPKGELVGALNAIRSERMVYEANYQLTKFYREALEADNEEAKTEPALREESQTALNSDWAQAVTANTDTEGGKAEANEA